MGVSAERLVQERIAAALPDGARLLPERRLRRAVPRRAGARWRGRPRRRPPGQRAARRRGQGRRAEPRRARPLVHRSRTSCPASPFAQAEAGEARSRAGDRGACPAWPRDLELRAGHAVAFPDVELASLPARPRPPRARCAREIVLDGDGAASTRRAPAERSSGRGRFWVGDGSRGRSARRAGRWPPSTSTSPRRSELRRLLRHDIDDDRARLLPRVERPALGPQLQNRATDGASRSSARRAAARAWSRSRRRAASRAKAGGRCTSASTSRSRPRSCARWRAGRGRRTATGRCTTFHRLCETLAERAGVLAAEDPPTPAWWYDGLADGARSRRSTRCPTAVPRDRGRRGPGLRARLARGAPVAAAATRTTASSGCSTTPGRRSYRRRRRRASSGSSRSSCSRTTGRRRRSAELAARFYRGPIEPMSMAEGGRAPSPDRGRARSRRPSKRSGAELHRLIAVEGVRPGRSWSSRAGPRRQRGVAAPAVRQRRAVERRDRRRGKSLGLPGELVPERAGRRRRRAVRDRSAGSRASSEPVVILCELPAEAERLDAAPVHGADPGDAAARHRHAAGACRAPSSARRPPVIVVRPGTARDSLGGTVMPHGSYDTTSPGVERATRPMSREAHR